MTSVSICGFIQCACIKIGLDGTDLVMLMAWRLSHPPKGKTYVGRWVAGWACRLLLVLPTLTSLITLVGGQPCRRNVGAIRGAIGLGLGWSCCSITLCPFSDLSLNGFSQNLHRELYLKNHLEFDEMNSFVSIFAFHWIPKLRRVLWGKNNSSLP